MDRRSAAQRAALVGPAVIVALIGAAAYFAIAAQRSAAEAAFSAQAVAESSNEVMVRLNEAESAARGFVVTGDSAFLIQFRAMSAGVSAPLAELRARGNSDLHLVDELETLTRLSARRLALLSAVVKARADSGFGNARDAVITGGGPRVMDTVRLTARAIVGHADSAARLSRLRARSRAELATLVVIVGIAGVLLLGLVVSALLLRAMHAEAANAREAMGQNERLVEQAEELQTQTEQLQDQAVRLEQAVEESALHEETIAISEESLRTLIEGLDAGVIFFGPDGSIKASNQSALRILGADTASLDKTVARVITEAVREDGSPFPEEQLPHTVTLTTGVEQKGVIVGLTFADGSRIWVSSNTRLARADRDGERGVIASFTDITEQREAELEAARQRTFLRTTVDHLSDGIVACDASGTLSYFNPATERIHGLPAEPLPPESWAERFDLYDESGERILRTEEIPLVRAFNGEVVANVPITIKPKGEPPRKILANGTAMYGRDGGKLGAVVVMRDTTELLEAQHALDTSAAHLRQAQKMEAIGRLAGGVAHDFNNLLTAITSYTQFLLDDTEAGDPRRADMEEIRGAADRAAALTRQLLAFSRRQVLHVERIEPNAVITNAKRLLERLIGEDIMIVLGLDPRTAPIYFDPSQLEQIIFNLAVNARDAMPEGGVLSIETDNVEITENEALQKGLQSGCYVALCVTDTGVGMDQETVARAFEPFFTTKESGKGTGLGLSTVYGIVAQSGGSISVESEVNHGTTFRILVRAAEAMEVEAVKPESSDPVPRGTETILLVEDDLMVRRAVERMLGTNGYTVAVAGSSLDALAMVGQENVDLLITDMIMPGLGGRELAERALALRPDLRVLMMSGYTDEAVESQGSPLEGISFLEKPFTSRDLNIRVRQVLDASIVAARHRASSALDRGGPGFVPADDTLSD